MVLLIKGRNGRENLAMVCGRSKNRIVELSTGYNEVKEFVRICFFYQFLILGVVAIDLDMLVIE